MDSQQFVELLRTLVRDSAASEELSILQDPPGKRPSPDVQERSKWYHSLDENQKRILSSVILDVADRAVFGFLCVLDGVRAIENSNRGRLELRYVNDKATLLNAPDGEMLHELW